MASFFLVPLLTGQRARFERLLIAAGYYAAGSVPSVAAVIGYWGENHTALGVAAWLGSSMLLATPWMFASSSVGALTALTLTAVPPLGVIGWLSPLNAAGALFPGSGLLGLGALCASLAWTASRSPLLRPATLAIVAASAIVCNELYVDPAPPAGWVGLHTDIVPSRGDALRAIQNNEAVIEAALMQAPEARVVVAPEAVLDDWWPGTREQFEMAIPRNQLWILGAETDSSDAVVAVRRARADLRPITISAGLILGGNWIPWSEQTLRPAWWQQVFSVDERRVWAALCVEQVQPWTWVEAMLQHPDLIVAMSNGWWTRAAGGLSKLGAAGLSIERASARSWGRLMGLPIIWADNR